MSASHPGGDGEGGHWTFLTNHARVLLHIARDPEVRLRDVSAAAGITERSAQAIVADLESAGYLTRTRVGRRNRYTVDPTVRLRHPAEAGHPVGDLLGAFLHREGAAAPEDPQDGGGASDGTDAAGPQR
ncbi:MarR family transcriptional regulator [Streptacidiphilus sp. ASG 303]|uniref:helix-turn-helix transcriptional regulator n=1 Tax=Streptacidiphilus sp. ASG 303 TaxID=2896847 RepID=UPI001E623975|nr:helix-turn-helix domain-containing protein [Streptacidiphilus sp. ASG 303]MCD0483661.1 MarR family transcriptional regulator [Streptacidiphilus sp. ASG 303]